MAKILKKADGERTDGERKLLAESSALLTIAEKRVQSSKTSVERAKELQDDDATLIAKCKQLASMIRKSKHCVVYTGAGISTSAKIPDYRGPQGVWTQLKASGAITETRDIAIAGKLRNN